VLAFGNNLNDNRIYLEAHNSTFTGSANELALTGYSGQPAPLISFYADTTYASGSVGIGTSPSNRLSVAGSADISGSVGIGVPNPFATLHVRGGNGPSGGPFPGGTPLLVENNGSCYLGLSAPSSNESGILFGNSTSAADASLYYNNGVTPRGLQFRTNGSETRLSITQSGNIGIGTANPVAHLEVAGGEVRLPAGAGNTQPSFLTHFNLSGNGANYIRGQTIIADSGGSVGIGTNSPGVRLDVAGDIRAVGHPDSTFLSAGGFIEMTGPNPYIDFHFGNDPSDFNARIINNEDGQLTIATPGSHPNVPLRVLGGREALPGSGGQVIIEREGQATKLVLGDNELLVRGGDQKLNLNADSGDVTIARSGTGLLGVGKDDPGFRIDLPNTANAQGRGRANDWVTYSSRRWKEDIEPIGDALPKLCRLQGVKFRWKAENGGTLGMGFVAEDVGATIPEIVQWEPDGENAQALAYGPITALAVEAIKEQQAQIDAHAGENQCLRDELESLRRQNEGLLKRMQSLEALLAGLADSRIGGGR
jgi:hypothetical protein